jgi:hypothetical protein
MKKRMSIFYTSLLLLLLFFLACTEKEKDSPVGKCGDGICDAIEKNKGLCPEDCWAETTTSTITEPSTTTTTSTKTAPGESFVTYVDSAGIGKIAVKVTLPETARYADGAPLIIYVSTFFTPGNPKFATAFVDVTDMGFIHVTYLWPGLSDPSGAKSEGTYDYGGEDSLQALHAVIRFASGRISNSDGYYITQLSEITPLTDDVGLYAFSHPGIAATNVLALYGDELSVEYFVGGENPTEDLLSAMDLGHYGGNIPVYNSLYTYPDDYSSSGISLDYSSVLYDSSLEAPYFDLDNDGKAEEGIDFIHGTQTPTMYGKKTYSVAMTRALVENGALTDADWPADIATLEEVEELWPFRETVENYPLLEGSDLKVLLVFAQKDHVQTVPDKPHIHQAYDGFTAAGLWVRLNPDSAYVSSLESALGALSPDNDANSEPADWMDIEDWAYPDKAGANTLISFAATAEMADRVYTDTWDKNLDEVLVATEVSEFK